MHSLLCLPMRVEKGLEPFRGTFIDGEIIWNGPWIVFALQRHRLSYVFQSKVLCIYNKVKLMRFCKERTAECDSLPILSPWRVKSKCFSCCRNAIIYRKDSNIRRVQTDNSKRIPLHQSFNAFYGSNWLLDTSLYTTAATNWNKQASWPFNTTLLSTRNW